MSRSADSSSSGVINFIAHSQLFPGAAQRETVRCRPGTQEPNLSSYGPRISGAPLRAAPRPGKASQRDLHTVGRDLATGGLDLAALGRAGDVDRVGVVDVDID